MEPDAEMDLAKFYATCVHSKSLHDLAEAVSPDFVFSSPRIRAYNFDQFCQLLKFWSVNTETSIDKIEKINNEYVMVETVQTIDIPNNYIETTTRKVFLTISDQLILSVTVEFEDPQEIEYLDALNPIPKEFGRS